MVQQAARGPRRRARGNKNPLLQEVEIGRSTWSCHDTASLAKDQVHGSLPTKLDKIYEASKLMMTKRDNYKPPGKSVPTGGSTLHLSFKPHSMSASMMGAPAATGGWASEPQAAQHQGHFDGSQTAHLAFHPPSTNEELAAQKGMLRKRSFSWRRK